MHNFHDHPFNSLIELSKLLHLEKSELLILIIYFILIATRCNILKQFISEPSFISL